MEDEVIGEVKDYGIRELILYKLDRTIAIGGLVAIGLLSIFKGGSPDLNLEQVIIAVVGVLGGYIGGRSVSK